MTDLIERDVAIKLIQPRVKPKTVYGEGYLNAIEHVTELLALMPSVNCWIPCSERMPEDDKEVLFAVIYPWDKKTRVTLGRRRTKKSGGSWWSNGYCHFSDYDVTHWMPLPEAPQRKDDAK